MITDPGLMKSKPTESRPKTAKLTESGSTKTMINWSMELLSVEPASSKCVIELLSNYLSLMRYRSQKYNFFATTIFG